MSFDDYHTFDALVDSEDEYDSDEGLLPSRNLTDWWIRVNAPASSCEGAVDAYTGKWLVYANPQHIDAAWLTISQATRAGDLGIGAKVSTAMARAGDLDKHVICVYTRDCRDLADVGRVLAKLRDLGFRERISYKEDGATMQRVYGKGAALYVAQPDSSNFSSRRQPISVVG